MRQNKRKKQIPILQSTDQRNEVSWSKTKVLCVCIFQEKKKDIRQMIYNRAIEDDTIKYINWHPASKLTELNLQIIKNKNPLFNFYILFYFKTLKAYYMYQSYSYYKIPWIQKSLTIS